MTDATAAAACRFVELVAQAQPDPGNTLDHAVVSAARKLAAEIRRDRQHTSRSGIPLTRNASCPR